jgi:hypothetical protein
MVGWDAVAAAVAEKTAVLAVGVVGHTDFEQQEPVAVESALIVERMVAHILQQPGADKGCTVGSQGVAVAVVVAETVPAVRVAVAAAAAAVVVVVAIGSFVSHHNHNLHTGQIAPVEGAVVRALALGQAQMATVGCTLAALEGDLLLML